MLDSTFFLSGVTVVCYCFGPFELDPATRVLRSQGQPVVITAKIFDLLLVLVENRDRVMRKDELLSQLWPDTSVEEANLAQSISVLRRTLDDNPKEHRYIVTVAGRGYGFVAPVSDQRLPNKLAPETARATARSSHRPRSYYVSRTAMAVLLLGTATYFAYRESSPSPFYSSTPLTSYGGSQICPSFAPDGERIAFAWNREGQGNYDIYVKQLGVAAPLRLTNAPGPNVSPAWSPDGRTIAFLHVIAQGKAEVLLISSIAPGPARKLATVSVPLPSEDLYIHLRFTAWSPDGKWIAVSDGEADGSLVLLSEHTGEYRRLTFPPSDYADFSPAFSADMRRFAFVRYSGSIAGDLYALKLSSDMKPLGEPERLTFYNRQITSPVWTKDGRALLFVKHEVAGSPSFWRMQIGRDRKVEPLPIPADSSFTMALSPSGHRLVYTRDSENLNIWAAELDQNHHVQRTRPFMASTWAEGNPQFSPDGRRIAYQSLQSGRLEIWICDRDGSHPRQLTELEAAVSGFPRWSPDGKKIVFHSRPKSAASLYVIDPDGGKPERLTGPIANNISPSWSHDGKWIYFASAREGTQYISRMPATGGAATRITERSGWCPLESRDGRFLFYVTGLGSILRAVPLSGGPEQELLSGVGGGGTSYAPAYDGIYYIRSLNHDRNRELAFFNSASHKVTTIGELEKPVWLGLALSPKEDLLLYSQVDQRVSNLMLVDNFR